MDTNGSKGYMTMEYNVNITATEMWEDDTEEVDMWDNVDGRQEQWWRLQWIRTEVEMWDNGDNRNGDTRRWRWQ